MKRKWIIRIEIGYNCWINDLDKVTIYKSEARKFDKFSEAKKHLEKLSSNYLIIDFSIEQF